MAVEYIPSRITKLERNMDWLTDTPFLTIDRGFLLRRSLGIFIPIRIKRHDKNSDH